MATIEFVKVIFLGLIQGITEWLPISSTGHMIIFDNFFPLAISDEGRNFLLVVIQLGSVMAVLVLFFKELWPKERKIWLLWAKIAVASVPAAVFGFLFEDSITSKLFNVKVVSIALIFYGIVFILIEKLHKKNNFHYKITSIEQISFLDALKIGFFQVLALIPGTSRSGSTIIGGMLVSLDRSVAAKFSFFLALPVMFGASFLEVVKTKAAFTKNEWEIIVIGTIVAFLVSFFVIRFLMDYVKKHSFCVFGYYRIVLGLLLLIFC